MRCFVFPACLVAITLAFLSLEGRAQTVQASHSWEAGIGGVVSTLRKGSDGSFYGVSSQGGADASGVVFRVAPDGHRTVLHSFVSASDGRGPNTALVEAPDGWFYGTTPGGGKASRGSLFRVNAAGDFQTVFMFADTSLQVASSGLMAAADGHLYGGAFSASGGPGVIYRLTTSGVLSTVYSLSIANGRAPGARLLQAADGNFYGTTVTGGTSNLGTIFKLTPAGAYTLLWSFSAADGAGGKSPLVQGPGGNLFGTADSGGANNVGTFFRITPDGAFSVLHHFAAATGSSPRGEIVLGSGGSFYGTTIRGGTNGTGVVYRVSAAGQFVRLRDFRADTSADFTSLASAGDGSMIGSDPSGMLFRLGENGSFAPVVDPAPTVGLTTPAGALVELPDGTIFGTTPYSVFGVSAAGVFETRYVAQAGLSGPIVGGLSPASDGFLYGARTSGASNGGELFRFAPATGALTTVGALPGGSPPRDPRGGPVGGGDGNFYATARSPFDKGSIFQMTPSGSITLIKAFDPVADGKDPSATLVQGSDGSLYGTTLTGDGSNFGTIFRVVPGASPQFETVVRFDSSTAATKGAFPNELLVVASDGNLYGTTQGGGASYQVPSTRPGTFFRLTPSGVHTVLASFGGSNGGVPLGALAIGADGAFYGTTSKGGSADKGTVFRVTTDGALSTLHSFSSTGPRTPIHGLTLGADGNLYGTTAEGGAQGLGSVFKITPAGVLTHLAEFDYRLGWLGAGPLFRARNGKLYGVNQKGGTGGGGVLFTIDRRPIFITQSTADIAPESARLRVVVDPLGLATTAEFFFEGESLGSMEVPAGDGPVVLEKLVSGLRPHTAYRFRAQARNADGAAVGAEQIFQTANRSPEAHGVVFHPTGRGVLEFPGLAPSTDADGDAVRLHTVSQGAHGRVAIEGATVRYTPGASFTGNDQFTFTIRDDFGGEDTATVTLVNSTPTAASRTLHPGFGPGGSVVVDLTPLIGDADGDTLTIADAASGSAGQTVLIGTQLTYTAGATFSGNDVVTFVVRDGAGASAAGSIVFTNAAPAAQPDAVLLPATGGPFAVLANDSDADGDALTIIAVSDAEFGTVTTDGRTVAYTPGVMFEGADAFTYTIADGRGATATATVTIRAAFPVRRTLVSQIDPVPGVEGAEWRSFGVPSLFAEGTRAGFLGHFRSADGKSGSGIFSGALRAPALQLRTGDAATDGAGAAPGDAVFRRFGQPVFAGEAFAFVGTLQGKGAKAGSDSGVWVNAGGELRAAAREGELAPGAEGTRFGAFLSLAMPRPDALFFMARLRSGVRAANDAGLWTWTPEAGTRLGLREGQTIEVGGAPRRLRAFRTLAAIAGSSGHARYDSAVGTVDVALEFTDGEKAVVSVAVDGSIALAGITGEADPGGRVPQAYGDPSSPGGGAQSVAIATFRAVDGRRHETAIYDFESGTVLAGENAEAPGVEGATFRSFLAPVAGRGSDGVPVVAFHASLFGASRAGDTGLWMARPSSGAALSLVAREGAEPPGVPGTRFAAFESVAVLAGRGAVFTARLASGAARVKRSEDRGCWAIASDGSLRLLLREGDAVGGKILRAFSLLGAVPGSSGQRRAWAEGDTTPNLLCLVHFTDGSEAILSVSVP